MGGQQSWPPSKRIEVSHPAAGAAKVPSESIEVNMGTHYPESLDHASFK